MSQFILRTDENRRQRWRATHVKAFFIFTFYYLQLGLYSQIIEKNQILRRRRRRRRARRSFRSPQAGAQRAALC